MSFKSIVEIAPYAIQAASLVSEYVRLTQQEVVTREDVDKLKSQLKQALAEAENSLDELRAALDEE